MTRQPPAGNMRQLQWDHELARWDRLVIFVVVVVVVAVVVVVVVAGVGL